MRVRYTQQAHHDLEAILSFVEQQSPPGARNFTRALYKTIEVIGQYPHSGRLAGEQGTRVLPVGRYPYLIYWSAEANDAWIVHIRHASRQPWYPDRDQFDAG